MNLTRGVVSAAVLAACAGSAFGDGVSDGALSDLMSAYPQARIHLDAGVVSMVYGAPMSAGESPAEAATSWMRDFSGVFGDPELTLNATRQIRDGKFTAFDYRQQVKGVPVEYGMLKVVVRNASGEAVDRVVFASGNVARVPAGFSVEPTVTPEAAVAMVGGLPEYTDLPEFGEPTLAVWFGDGAWGAPALAWKFVGEYAGPAGARRFTFFVDAQSGDLLRARSEIYYDIAGAVNGKATPGILPDSASNPAVSWGVPEVRVGASPAGVNAFSARDGLFTLVFGGGAAQIVSSSLANGRWSSITTAEGSVLTASQSGVVAPGPASLLFNPTPSEFPTSQVNAFIQTNLIHNYIDDRADFPEIDIALQTNTNYTTAGGITGCNAFFTVTGGTPSINFFRALDGCVNTSYASVVAHEYGHFIVSSLGLAQGGFGEGFGDSVAMLLHDNNRVGPDFFGPGTNIRLPVAANQQYPCSSGAVHTCGQILGGTWYEIRNGFVAQYGAGPGLAQAQQLQVDWAMITNGGTGSNALNSAHPGTAIEVLTMDDDDGILANGTPNYDIICGAFNNHAIDCPPVQRMIFEYPDGVPALVTPGQNESFAVRILPNGQTPIPATARIDFSVNGGPVQQGTVQHMGGNDYTATIPAQDCSAGIEFYLSVSSSQSTVVSPETAPGVGFEAIAATSLVGVFADDGETNPGWTVTNSGTLTDGPWDRGVPVNCSRGDPAADFDGSGQCWLTDNSAASGCNSDVDGGTTTLLSPVFDCSSGEAFISYARWYSNNFGASPNEDTFVVGISNNNGATWTTLENVGPTGSETGGGWVYKTFKVSQFVAPTSQVRIRFQASDLINGSVVEAGVDAVSVDIAECAAACPADLSTSSDPNDPGYGVPDGNADSADFFYYLDQFVGGNAAVADLTGSSDPNSPAYGVPDGMLDAADFFYFLDLFVQGCP